MPDKEEVEERTEYRIIGEREDGTRWKGSPQRGPTDSWDFQNYIKEHSRRNRYVSVQKRTVTETPWEDVTDDAA